MNQKILVPVVALVLALLAGLGMWLVLRDKNPKPQIAANEAIDPDGPPVRSKDKPEFNARDYDPAVASPDPVVTQRRDPFRAPETMFRLEVTGRVVDEAGLAVADARVRFLGEGSLQEFNGSVYSDGAGRYSLVAWNARGVNPPTGQRSGRIVVEDSQGRLGVSASAALPDETIVSMPDTVLASAGELRGRVQDDTGAPVTGVVVSVRSQVQYESIPEGLRTQRVQHAFVSSGVTTDNRGEFRLTGLRPGKYTVEVERSYFGQVAATQEAEVTGAGAAWLDVNVKASAWLRGVVRDSDGQPIAGVVVRTTATQAPTPPPVGSPGGDGKLSNANLRNDVTRIDGGGRGINARMRGVLGNSGLTDDQGRFGFFGLHEGKWQVSTKVGEATAVVEDQSINGPDIILVVQADSVLSGVVRDAETGRGVENFDLRLVRGGDERASPLDRVTRDRAFPWRPGGEWRLVNPPAGNVIRVSAAGYLPAVLRIDDIKPGERRANMEIRLMPLCELSVGLSYQGRRLELEPVMLLYDRNLAHDSTCDAQGRVRIPAVAPARYAVRVILRDGTRLAGTLDVPAKSSASLEIELTPSAEK